MSNIVAIAKFPEGFRVSYTENIENITNNIKGSKIQKKHLKATFKDSKIFAQESSAFLEARRIEREIERNGINIQQRIGYIGVFDKF